MKLNFGERGTIKYMRNFNENDKVHVCKVNKMKNNNEKRCFFKIIRGCSFYSADNEVKMINKIRIKNLKNCIIPDKITILKRDICESNCKNKIHNDFMLRYNKVGIPLDQYLEENDLNVNEKKKLMLNICNAVFELHQKEIIHMDLKPENLLIYEGEVIIIY